MNAVSNRYISMEFEPELTEDLVAEGMIREVVSRIQNSKKSSGFGVTDKISVSVNTSDSVKRWIEKHLEYLQTETLATFVDFELPDNMGEHHVLEMGELRISVVKIKVD